MNYLKTWLNNSDMPGMPNVDDAVEVYLVEQVGPRPDTDFALMDALKYARANFEPGATVFLEGTRADMDVKNTYWVFAFKISGCRLRKSA